MSYLQKNKNTHSYKVVPSSYKLIYKPHENYSYKYHKS